LRIAAALVLVAVLAGCGGKAATPEERFAASGNAICRETAKTSQDLQRAKAPGYRAKLNAAGREGQRRLRALEPPASLRKRRDRFFADLRQLEIVSSNPGERPKAVALMNRLPDEARALGWDDCAG
jgi:hypothetical protein